MLNNELVVIKYKLGTKVGYGLVTIPFTIFYIWSQIIIIKQIFSSEINANMGEIIVFLLVALAFLGFIINYWQCFLTYLYNRIEIKNNYLVIRKIFHKTVEGKTIIKSYGMDFKPLYASRNRSKKRYNFLTLFYDNTSITFDSARATNFDDLLNYSKQNSKINDSKSDSIDKNIKEKNKLSEWKLKVPSARVEKYIKFSRITIDVLTALFIILRMFEVTSDYAKNVFIIFLGFYFILRIVIWRDELIYSHISHNNGNYVLKMPYIALIYYLIDVIYIGVGNFTRISLGYENYLIIVLAIGTILMGDLIRRIFWGTNNIPLKVRTIIKICHTALALLFITVSVFRSGLFFQP